MGGRLLLGQQRRCSQVEVPRAGEEANRRCCWPVESQKLQRAEDLELELEVGLLDKIRAELGVRLKD